VDTWSKDGRGLLEHLPIERLSALSAGTRAAGLLFAVAGSLDPGTISRIAPMADVLGVRGAACRGGRSGTVTAELVAELRRRVGSHTVVAWGEVSAFSYRGYRPVAERGDRLNPISFLGV
jgi:hypothetical protein